MEILLRLSITRDRTLKFETQLTIAFFAAVNHNYDDNEWNLKKERFFHKQTIWIEIYQSQSTDVTFWSRCSEVPFTERFVKRKTQPLCEPCKAEGPDGV